MHYEEEAVAKHFFDLRGQTCPFRIINSDGFMGGMIEATAALQKGEILTIMGDRLGGGQSIEVNFLGTPSRLPISAYVLAVSTGAYVGVVFTAKTGKKSYKLRVWDIFQVQYHDRSSRESEIKKSAKLFAKSLEEYLREYPYQWYNFYDYWNNN
jgi:predicted LPLAT superfamily acyltransferase